MKFSVIALAVVLATLKEAQGFSFALQRSTVIVNTSPVVLCLSDGSSDDNIPKRSRIEGNQVDPTGRDLEIIDEMITKLSNAKLFELPNAVRRAFRVVSSPRFFMRIAERTDATNDTEEKQKLEALASNLVVTLNTVVETTEEQLEERAKEVEAILKAGAEPQSGEFLVPLLPAQLEEMRNVMELLEPSSLDEGFLSTIDSWMNKSHEDGMDGMVGILQKILQMYSGIQIVRARESQDTSDGEPVPAAKIFDKLMKSDTDNWDAELRESLKDIKASALIAEIQRTMETVVLGLENGSTAQRVQAEYLRELVTRAEALQ